MYWKKATIFLQGIFPIFLKPCLLWFTITFEHNKISTFFKKILKEKVELLESIKISFLTLDLPYTLNTYTWLWDKRLFESAIISEMANKIVIFFSNNSFLSNSYDVHEITASPQPLSGMISCVTARISFLPVTVTGRFSKFQ